MCSRRMMLSNDFERAMTRLSKWGRWGKDDRRGTVNLLTPARRTAAAALATDGIAVSLARDLNAQPSVDNPAPFIDRVTPSVEGQFNVDESTIDRFIAAIGSEREEVWDERIWDWDVKVDGNLASVWVPYAFYRGEQLSHCGVDAFQLVRLDGEWKILHVIDTRRREGCTGPPR